MPLNHKAALFLVATPIGNLSEVSQRCLDVLKSVDVIACEDTRNTQKLLSHFDIHTRTITYHNFNEKDSTKGIIKLLENKENVALVSDAGYPLISDPGYQLVNEVIGCGFDIITISGPNAALNALVASGLPTSHYLFYGFLNPKSSQAAKELEALKSFPYTLIFYEAPHRIEKTIALALKILGDRKACLARELTKIHEEYHRGTLKQLSELHDLKGEMVLIVEGCSEVKKEDMGTLLQKVNELIASGYRAKEAISEIAGIYDVSRNSLYDAYLEEKKQGEK